MNSFKTILRSGLELLHNILVDVDGLSFLFRADFCVDDAAPLGTHSPEIGSDLTFVETDGEFSIASNVMDIPSQGTPVWGDLGFYSDDAYTRADGLASSE